ncbi:MAG: GNAT family N-acetyltransferase [Prevotella sp.]|jgi:DNA-3-methyladenine glycosylase I|nr:GNAT family N-acetyltransferase [Prevotella sp.]
MTITSAEKSQANAIARLIMQAMNYDCCQFFAGEDHTLDEFEQLMTRLVEAEESQYSYKNTLVALGPENVVMGICVSYDGARLHELRKAFIRGAKEAFGKDFSGISDETGEGELYIDSLAVGEQYRKRGIATALLKATLEKGRALQLPAVGLLVDTGNPQAEKLYTAIGFKYVDRNQWGGHPMKHLQVVF